MLTPSVPGRRLRIGYGLNGFSVIIRQRFHWVGHGPDAAARSGPAGKQGGEAQNAPFLELRPGSLLKVGLIFLT
jgi:hypothetical protein